ncbi:MAG: FHA domain-containing protein [Acidobacteriaceae bacterium]|nr:FHA domain-containing protein [Acidobacteriaceae bacterium]
MASRTSNPAEPRFNGNVVISELIRNMELGQFEMAYTVLLPCVFTVYLNPEDHSNLKGVFELITEDAKRALRTRVAQLNGQPSRSGVTRPAKNGKEYKIASRDWIVEFFPHPEVPRGDVEIHSELSETPEPGYRGTKTTLLERSPTATLHNTSALLTDTRRALEPVFAEIRYEDDSGHQVYLVTQNRVRVGRGGDGASMDLALYTNEEVSREHLVIRRDAATGVFFILDTSKNGTWLNRKRLRKGVEELLPNEAEIGIGKILALAFRAR